MGKIMKPGKVVIVLRGKYAGRKAVVAGIDRCPKRVHAKMPAKKIARRSRVKAFVKTLNYNHVMPTRYQLDLDLQKKVKPEDLEVKGKRSVVKKQVRQVL